MDARLPDVRELFERFRPHHAGPARACDFEAIWISVAGVTPFLPFSRLDLVRVIYFVYFMCL